MLTNQRHPYGETLCVLQLVKQDLLITQLSNYTIVSSQLMETPDSDSEV